MVSTKGVCRNDFHYKVIVVCQNKKIFNFALPTARPGLAASYAHGIKSAEKLPEDVQEGSVSMAP
jgi:hypothetical protein